MVFYLNINPTNATGSTNSTKQPIKNENVKSQPSIFSSPKPVPNTKTEEHTEENNTEKVRIEQEYNKHGVLTMVKHYHQGEQEPFMYDYYDESGKAIRREVPSLHMTTEYFYDGDVLIREEEYVADSDVIGLGELHNTYEYSKEQGYTGKERPMDRNPIKETNRYDDNDGKIKETTEIIDGKEVTTVYKSDNNNNLTYRSKSTEI